MRVRIAYDAQATREHSVKVGSERGNSDLKENHGGRSVRVRGRAKRKEGTIGPSKLLRRSEPAHHPQIRNPHRPLEPLSPMLSSRFCN